MWNWNMAKAWQIRVNRVVKTHTVLYFRLLAANLIKAITHWISMENPKIVRAESLEKTEEEGKEKTTESGSNLKRFFVLPQTNFSYFRGGSGKKTVFWCGCSCGLLSVRRRIWDHMTEKTCGSGETGEIMNVQKFFVSIFWLIRVRIGQLFTFLTNLIDWESDFLNEIISYEICLW